MDIRLQSTANMERAITHFRHLVASVDFEHSSQNALEMAVDLAIQFEARLTIVHAWEIPSYAYAGITFMPSDTWTVVERAARQLLEETLATVQKRLPRAEALLAKGPAGQAILEAIKTSGCDLVVTGTHGRHGLGRMMLGSVAEKVVRGSPVPVLTVHGREPS